MTRVQKIVYWVSTVWMALGLVSTGIVQVMGIESGIAPIVKMGFPPYFLALLGFWKLMGAIATLMPKLPLVKEWAYAGIIFMMSGAVYTHAVFGSAPADFFGPILLLVLAITSWWFRPADRRIAI